MLRNIVLRCAAAPLVFACSTLALRNAAAQEIGKVGASSGYVSAADGLKIHYVEANPNTPSHLPAMILVPGWTMPADIWEYQLAHFSQSRRVVAMEPRSYGLSSQTAEGNYPEGHARDIKLVLDQLKLRPAILVGWSYGVDDVLAYLDQFGTDSVAALVLVDEKVVFDHDFSFFRQYLTFSWNLQKDRLSATTRFVRQMYKKPRTEEYIQRISREAMLTPDNTAVALLVNWMAVDRSSMLSKIDKPTLIVSASYGGSQSYLKTQRDMAAQIRGSQLEVFEDAGHALFVDDADRFNQVVGEFLAKLSK
jgi:microsomal epoxide hydrolase